MIHPQQSLEEALNAASDLRAENIKLREIVRAQAALISWLEKGITEGDACIRAALVTAKQAFE